MNVRLYCMHGSLRYTQPYSYVLQASAQILSLVFLCYPNYTVAKTHF